MEKVKNLVKKKQLDKKHHEEFVPESSKPPSTNRRVTRGMLKQVTSIKEAPRKVGEIFASSGVDNAPIEVTNEIEELVTETLRDLMRERLAAKKLERKES